MLIDLDETKIPFQVEESILNELHFKAYHCMRGFSEDIKQQGLKCFNFEEHLGYVQSKLLQYGVSLELITEYFCAVRREFFGAKLTARENNICFCLNKNLFKSGAGCRNFFKYFGGETVYRVAKYSDAYPEIKYALENIGTPLLVTSTIYLKTASESQRNNVLQFLAGNSINSCEVFIQENVNPENIMEIEVYE